MAKNSEFHKRTKHIDIRYHFVREKVAEGEVVLEYCPIKDMKANIMTKPITVIQFQRLRNTLGIKAPKSAESSGSVVEEAPRPEVETERYVYTISNARHIDYECAVEDSSRLRVAKSLRTKDLSTFTSHFTI